MRQSVFRMKQMWVRHENGEVRVETRLGTRIDSEADSLRVTEVARRSGQTTYLHVHPTQQHRVQYYQNTAIESRHKIRREEDCTRISISSILIK